MKGIVHFKDLESDEETTINGGIINCNELKARDKLIVYGDVWEEEWDEEREDYITVDTGVDKEFEVVSFAQISPIFSLMYAFQGIDKVIIATPTDECPDPEIQTHHLTVSYVVSGGCSLTTPMELETTYTSQSYVSSLPISTGSSSTRRADHRLQPAGKPLRITRNDVEEGSDL